MIIGHTLWKKYMIYSSAFLVSDTVRDTHNLKEGKFNLAYVLRDLLHGHLALQRKCHGGWHGRAKLLGSWQLQSTVGEQCQRGKDEGAGIDLKTVSP